MVVSVLMGVYHRGKDTQDLKNAVESILNQSYSNFEFLICPCGSSPQAPGKGYRQPLPCRQIKLLPKGGHRQVFGPHG